MSNILITTFGSFGDIHPYIAVALELKRRGHSVCIGTSEIYRQKILSEEISFAAIPPDLPDLGDAEQVMRRAMHPTKGPEVVFRELVIPYIRASFDAVNSVSGGVDLFVSHPLTFATPMIAELRQKPWASSALAPISYFSAHDPSVLCPAPWFHRLAVLGPKIYSNILHLMKGSIRNWSRPVDDLRRSLDLPLVPNLLFEGQHSPHLSLAMFSRALGMPQPDWPASAVQTGFCFYDQLDADTNLPNGLEDFINSGPPPVVFTLGSAAVMDPGDFYEISTAAAKACNVRAVMLVGREGFSHLPGQLPEEVAAFEYAPYSWLFPKALVNVHQGGVGTTGQALASGRPMLVVPYSHDQPDNAERCRKLGVARVIQRRKYKLQQVVKELSAVLGNQDFNHAASSAAEIIRSEGGARTAADALEDLLRRG